MNWEAILTHWPIAKPWRLRPSPQGAHNLTQIVETPAGGYILRTYRSDRQLAQIRFELSILTALQHTSLSYAVPVPLPTVTGELLIEVSGTTVALSPLLPGSAPQHTDLEQTRAAGKALAQLTQALGEVKLDITPQSAPFPSFGDLPGWQGGTTSPEAIISQLPLSD